MTDDEAMKALEVLTFQRYDPAPAMHGMFYHRLKKHHALEGAFMEVFRLSEAEISGLPSPFEARQISVSWAEPHRINAFHLHPKRIQDELWCVLNGKLLVWLADLRPDSPTFGVKRSVLLTGEEPGLLHIPSGVAHGYRAGAAGALLLYAMNDQFDLADPNEGRLPWDVFGPELWEEDRG